MDELIANTPYQACKDHESIIWRPPSMVEIQPERDVAGKRSASNIYLSLVARGHQLDKWMMILAKIARPGLLGDAPCPSECIFPSSSYPSDDQAQSRFFISAWLVSTFHRRFLQCLLLKRPFVQISHILINQSICTTTKALFTDSHHEIEETKPTSS
ncbi:hypothetical protein MJO28_001408 [Puccinia striiformis f. sp. tritici]|uniref:Uncharacterized protein n=1 Tax=Puccinia striiformis f. sp. tritici TaxID=168172 RepID=A0ACC0EVG4_9BASI|nr:hypothetical protein MJO28_001408 [Puccinia striiformis f. sp. tritici]